MKIKRASAFVTIAVAASLVLAGCGGDSSSTDSTDSTEATESTEATAEASEDGGQSTTISMAWGNVASQVSRHAITVSG